MKRLCERAKKIKLLILDVDGILTDGVLYYDSQEVSTRSFHIQDGLGLKVLQQAGIRIAIISGKKSAEVIKRLTELNIELIFLGHEKKYPIYNDLKEQLKLTDEEIAYMGDDLPDLPILKKVGLAATVPEAPIHIQKHAHIITTKKGGHGAVREICDFIIEAQNKLDDVLAWYLI